MRLENYYYIGKHAEPFLNITKWHTINRGLVKFGEKNRKKSSTRLNIHFVVVVDWLKHTCRVWAGLYFYIRSFANQKWENHKLIDLSPQLVWQSCWARWTTAERKITDLRNKSDQPKKLATKTELYVSRTSAACYLPFESQE